MENDVSVNINLKKGRGSLYHHMLRISQLVRALLIHFPLRTNPLERRMGPLLIEMDWAVYHILNLLQSQNLDRVALKR